MLDVVSGSLGVNVRAPQRLLAPGDPIPQYMRGRSRFVITSAVATPIEVPFPNVAAPHLRITAYACLLQIEPGMAEPWVQGSYQDPSGRIELHITHNADGTELRLGTDARDLLRSSMGHRGSTCAWAPPAHSA
jgi:hypothetical protein